MADIVLFHPKWPKLTARASAPHIPLGLLSIAAPLVENNYKVKIIDEQTSISWLDELNKEIHSSTICAGVSSMTGGQILGALNFSKTIKDRFDIPVVWGGLHASMLPEQTLKNNLVDIVVRGEGEESFLGVVSALKHGKSLEDIPNIWWKEDGSIYSNPKEQFIDLNNLPLLPYHLLDIEKYITGEKFIFPKCKRIFTLHTDRGCPHRCGFCYNININKCKWRNLTASKVTEQIEYLVKKFSLDAIDFTADNFFVDKKRVIDICSEIIKRKIRISWHADCRIDYFARYDNSFIDLLKESGCKALTFGIESGSERILNLIQKDISLADVFKANEKLKKRQIGVGYHFMAGFPGESKKEVLKTYEIMLKLFKENPDASFLGPTIYTPYPGTPLYNECLRMGFRPPEQLQDWIKFDWEETYLLPFMGSEYSKWLKETVRIARRGTVNTKKLQWLGQWYRIRTKIIVKFNIIGPQPEEVLIRIIRFVKVVAIFVKKILKLK